MFRSTQPLSSSSTQPLTVSQLFPSPFSPSPVTQQSVPSFTQLQQLCTLTATCCCLPNGHLLVVTETESVQPKQLLPTTPRSVRVFEFKMTETTSREEFANFILRCDVSGPSAAIVGNAALSTNALPRGNRMPPGHQRYPTGSSDTPDDLEDDNHMLISPSSGNQAPIVIHVHNLLSSSRSMLSTLMDLMVHAQLCVGGAVRRVPNVRILGIVWAQEYALLPHYFRDAFVASIFLTSQAILSAQTFGAEGGTSVVNKARLVELLTGVSSSGSTPGGKSIVSSPVGPSHQTISSGSTQVQSTLLGGIPASSSAPQQQPASQVSAGGCASSLHWAKSDMMRFSPLFAVPSSKLLDAVHVATPVERYLRHLLSLIRGSLSPSSSQAMGLVGHYARFLEALKILTYLFFPVNDDVINPPNTAPRRLLVNPTDISSITPFFTTHRIAISCLEWQSAAPANGPQQAMMLSPGGFDGANTLPPPSTSLTSANEGAHSNLSVAPPPGALGGVTSAPPSSDARVATQVASAQNSTRSAALWDAVTVTASSLEVPCRLGGKGAEVDKHLQYQIVDSSTTGQLNNAGAVWENSSTIAPSSANGKGLGISLTLNATDLKSSFRDSHQMLSYDLCRQIVLLCIRERSLPPPG